MKSTGDLRKTRKPDLGLGSLALPDDILNIDIDAILGVEKSAKESGAPCEKAAPSKAPEVQNVRQGLIKNESPKTSPFPRMSTRTKPQSVIEWFDVNNPEHIQTLRTFVKTGNWNPPDIRCDDLTYPRNWVAQLTARTALAWMNHIYTTHEISETSYAR